MLNVLCSIFLVTTSDGQNTLHPQRAKPWNAQWITGPGTELNRSMIENSDVLKSFGVYNFRKLFFLDTLHSSFLIHVSADNRYKLYVNEKLVSLGPARGDLYFWNYESVNIRPFLQHGKNVIAAIVWNFGELSPEAQISYRTGFILQGNSQHEEIINTNNTWKAAKDSSYRLLNNQVPGYYVAGPGELIEMNLQHRGWRSHVFNDTLWSPARHFAAGHTKETLFDSPAWMLVPSSIPQMEMKYQRIIAVRKAEGVSVPLHFL